MSTLDAALHADKKAAEALNKFLAADEEANVAWQAYAGSETCITVRDVFLRMTELHEIWMKALRDLIGQKSYFRTSFKDVYEGNRQLEDARKHVETLTDKALALQKKKAGCKVDDKQFQALVADLTKVQAEMQARKSALTTHTENHNKFKHNRLLTSTSVLMTCVTDALAVGGETVEAVQKLILLYADQHHSHHTTDFSAKAITAMKIVNDLRRKHGLSSLVIPADGINFTVSALPGEAGGHEITYSATYVPIPEALESAMISGPTGPTGFRSQNPSNPGETAGHSGPSGHDDLSDFAIYSDFNVNNDPSGHDSNKPAESLGVPVHNDHPVTDVLSPTSTLSSFIHTIQPSAPLYESGGTWADIDKMNISSRQHTQASQPTVHTAIQPGHVPQLHPQGPKTQSPASQFSQFVTSLFPQPPAAQNSQFYVPLPSQPPASQHSQPVTSKSTRPPAALPRDGLQQPSQAPKSQRTPSPTPHQPLPPTSHHTQQPAPHHSQQPASHLPSASVASEVTPPLPSQDSRPPLAILRQQQQHQRQEHQSELYLSLIGSQAVAVDPLYYEDANVYTEDSSSYDPAYDNNLSPTNSLITTDNSLYRRAVHVNNDGDEDEAVHMSIATLRRDYKASSLTNSVNGDTTTDTNKNKRHSDSSKSSHTGTSESSLGQPHSGDNTYVNSATARAVLKATLSAPVPELPPRPGQPAVGIYGLATHPSTAPAPPLPKKRLVP